MRAETSRFGPVGGRKAGENLPEPWRDDFDLGVSTSKCRDPPEMRSLTREPLESAKKVATRDCIRRKVR
jgi:phosphate uptake regulator